MPGCGIKCVFAINCVPVPYCSELSVIHECAVDTGKYYDSSSIKVGMLCKFQI